MFSQRHRQPFSPTPCRDLNIGALELLTKQIATDVQALASTLESPHWGGPGKYLDQCLLRSLHIAFTQGLAIVGGLINATSPINRMPPEILGTVFALSPRLIPHRQWGRASLPCWPFEEIDVGDLHKLPKVCRYWRELTLAMPTLWNSVSTHTPATDKSPPHCHSSELWFRRSLCLPQESPVELVVHCFSSFETTPHSREKMTEFMLTNAHKTRELHAWNVAAIRDVPLFIRSFDASALQHCAVWNSIGSRVWPPPPEIRFQTFFSQGGSRLRSLSLAGGVCALPSNEFPMLTLLSINAGYPYSSVFWDTSDLIKFLAGCPRLEEVYVYSKEVSGRDAGPLPPHMSPPPPTRIGLPRLRCLAFTYIPNSDWDKREDEEPTGIAYLLSHTAIPSTCDMHLAAIDDGGFCFINPGILNSVRRNVPGKDAVTHVFMRLATEASDIQLMFPEGSLRLQVPTSSKFYVDIATASNLAHVFDDMPELFVCTEELRIHYSDHDTHARLLASSTLFLASFPAVKVLSVLQAPPLLDAEPNAAPYPLQVDVGPGTEESESLAIPPVSESSALALYLAQPFPQWPPVCPSHPEYDSDPKANSRIPFPALDTLWTVVRSRGEIAHLEATLVARRAALGRPVHRLVVSVCGAELEDSSDRSNGLSASLRALTSLGAADEVVLMELGASEEPRVVDWMAKLPERFALPPAIHRDWPTLWYDGE